MADVYSPLSITGFPTEVEAAVAEDAAADAERVILFLRCLGMQASLDKPQVLPAGFLLQLGAALRLLSWEVSGFFFHRKAGLPEAKEAILAAFRLLNDSKGDSTEFCLRVLRLSVERFAWHGRRVMNATVAIDDSWDDPMLDALANYLWASRHVGPVTDCT